MASAAERIYLMTGATSGLGHAAARAVLADPSARLIVGVRTPDRARALADLPQDRLTVLPADLASLASVAAFCAAVRGRLGEDLLSGIALNAGVQITTGLESSADGIERTFAVNHLAHWLIAERLGDRLALGARIVATASGTHDPADPVARRFGFRGGVFPSATRVAAGDLDLGASPAQACLDRYATSKMANVMHVLRAARVGSAATWIAYDPGLMPGTGLARDRSAAVRFVWGRVMPAFRLFMGGISTPDRSGAMLARLLTGAQPAEPGDYVDFTGRTQEPWAETRDVRRQDDLHAVSERLAAAAV